MRNWTLCYTTGTEGNIFSWQQSYDPTFFNIKPKIVDQSYFCQPETLGITILPKPNGYTEGNTSCR